jgi:MFS family permease
MKTSRGESLNGAQSSFESHHVGNGGKRYHPLRRLSIFFGWFVLAGAVVSVMLGYSIRYSFSIFYAEILDEFGWSRAKTAGAFSLNMIIYGISSPIIGTLVDRLGPRRLLIVGTFVLAVGLLGMSQMQSIVLFYLLFGLVLAIGINSLGFPIHHAYIPNWFIARRGLALGILTSGQGASIILVAAYQYLISSTGWRSALMILAFAIAAVVIPLAFLLVYRTPEEINLKPDIHSRSSKDKGTPGGNIHAATALIVDQRWAATDWTLMKAIKTHRFWGMFFTYMTYSITYNLIMAHQPIYCQDIGFSPIFAASIFGLVGVTLIVGNLSNFVSDRIGRENTFILGTLGAMVAMLSLQFASVSHAWLLYVYAVFFGFFFGMNASVCFSSAADLFAGKGYGSILGSIILGFGIGGAIGPWLGGRIFDLTNSYSLAFVATMASAVLCCLCLCVAAPRSIRLVPGKAPHEERGSI